jgi:secreted PhoX family phosphatase
MRRPDLLPVPHDDDADLNTSGNPSFLTVLDARLTRRGMLRGGVGGAAAAVLGGLGLTACGGSDNDDPPVAAPPPAPQTPSAVTSLSFTPVAKSVADSLTVAAGYSAAVLLALGDPLTAATPAYANDGTDTDFDNRAGDHHDGMEYFGLAASGAVAQPSSNDRGLLVINHEALSQNYLHPAGESPRPRPVAESDKEIPAHGVSVVEVAKTGGVFGVVRDSALNRRITPLTPMQMSGPARGNALVRTKYSPSGNDVRGTINNCGSGRTPWGTYLAPEENWAGYFTRGAADNAARTAAGDAKSVVSLNRNGRAQGAASRHGWETSGADDKYRRWDISLTGATAADDYRNELNTYGYNVEIDPYDRGAVIKKRSAMGRFAHESSAYPTPVVGKPLAYYMGDDSRGEYIYKYVSNALWAAADASSANRIATGDKYLDDGKLYVAEFNADGTGSWIELAFTNPTIAGFAGYTFADQGDVCVNSRLAADAVGATKMDRPEWCAVHPTNGEVYFTLTNNSNRKVEPVGSGQQAVDAVNPRAYSDSFGGGAPSAPGNINGHIIRMAEAGGEPVATTFTWDVYLFGAQADADPAKVNLSGLTNDQDFSSPDGLWFSQSTGLCWIQTDDGAYTDVTNCMMLAAVPGQLGDGAPVTLNYTKGDGSTVSVTTPVGAKPAADKLRRFLVGPVDCEITGITETPDGRTLFVNVQHPGETASAATVAAGGPYVSNWPGNTGYGAGGATARPRSATIVITKNDGGRIGS